uniref:Small ribosomal subunit protein uS15 n=1 Tax=Saimiri boliviensis boliviensis TaxID=39432 RepID=A0A2K6V201_SAIBB
MGCMHTPGKGLSPLALSHYCSVPTWLKKEQIYKLVKKGLTPPQISVILRDSHGVAQVCFVTGNNILRIIKSGRGLAPGLPEDLYRLIKKAVAVEKHLERNRKDKDRAGFTVWLDFKRPSKSPLPTGNMNHLQPLSWSHKFVCVLKQ